MDYDQDKAVFRMDTLSKHHIYSWNFTTFLGMSTSDKIQSRRFVAFFASLWNQDNSVVYSWSTG
jgi:hypothetical protein